MPSPDLLGVDRPILRTDVVAIDQALGVSEEMLRAR
jgi:hypothetical protein